MFLGKKMRWSFHMNVSCHKCQRLNVFRRENEVFNVKVSCLLNLCEWLFWGGD